MTIEALIAFLAEHVDLLALIYEAITGGKATKAQVTAAVTAAMVAASDAEIEREFPA